MSPRVTSLVFGLVAACGSTAKPGPDLPTTQPPAPSTGTAPVAAPVVAPALDPPQPTLRLPRNFTPTAIRARLAIDPASDGFTGSIEIEGDLRERSRGLWLHGRKLAVTAGKITQPGRSVNLDVAAVGDDLLSLHPAE